MAAFDSDAFLLDDAFSGDAFDFAGLVASVASDGGCIWPPRQNDPRWIAFMTANGVTPGRGGIGNDVREALGNSLGLSPSASRRIAVDNMWKKYLNSVGKKNISSEDAFPPP